eukprot:UN24465
MVGMDNRLKPRIPVANCEGVLGIYNCQQSYQMNGKPLQVGGYIDPSVACAWEDRKCNEMTELIGLWDGEIPQSCPQAGQQYAQQPGQMAYNTPATRLWWAGQTDCSSTNAPQGVVPVRITLNCEKIMDPILCGSTMQPNNYGQTGAADWMETKCAWDGVKCNEMSEWYGIIKDAAKGKSLSYGAAPPPQQYTNYNSGTTPQNNGGYNPYNQNSYNPYNNYYPGQGQGANNGNQGYNTAQYDPYSMNPQGNTGATKHTHQKSTTWKDKPISKLHEHHESVSMLG